MRYAHIVGWGKYVPSRIMTNDELGKMVDTSDEWIFSHTGIRQRRIAADHESTSTMATQAAIAALDVAGVSPTQIDQIIVATSTPENFFPSVACLVQDALGADHAGAFDLSAACSGFVYALSVGADTIKAGNANTVLVIGAETFSRIIDWKDRNTCILFGDGAGAVVLQGSDQPGGVLSTILRADGSGGDLLCLSANGNRPKSAINQNSNVPMTDAHFVQMNGREVFKFATRVVDRTLRDLCNKVGWETQDVDAVVPHQANIRIIEAAAKYMGVSLEKFVINLDRYGNTSAASIPLALCEAHENGRLRTNDKLLTIGFGAGLTWAAAAIHWTGLRSNNRTQRVVNRVGYSLTGIRTRARRLIRQAEDRVFGTETPAPAATPSPAVKPTPPAAAPVTAPAAVPAPAQPANPPTAPAVAKPEDEAR